MAQFDAQYLNPDGSLNLAAIYSSGGAGDAAQAAQGGGQYRDYGNVTGPSMYTSEGDPGSTPAYWGGSPFGVGGQQAYDPAAHGGATNPYAASLLAQLAPAANGGGAGGAAAGWGQGGAQGAAAGFAPRDLGPEYYDPNVGPSTAANPGSYWSFADGRWQMLPGTDPNPNTVRPATAAESPGAFTGGPGQPPSVYAEQGPGEASIYPGGAGTPAVNRTPTLAPAPQLTGAALVNAPAGYTSTWANPAGGPGVPTTPAAVIKRLTGSKIAAPVAGSSSSSGLINWR